MELRFGKDEKKNAISSINRKKKRKINPKKPIVIKFPGCIDDTLNFCHFSS